MECHLGKILRGGVRKRTCVRRVPGSGVVVGCELVWRWQETGDSGSPSIRAPPLGGHEPARFRGGPNRLHAGDGNPEPEPRGVPVGLRVFGRRAPQAPVPDPRLRQAGASRLGAARSLLRRAEDVTRRIHQYRERVRVRFGRPVPGAGVLGGAGGGAGGLSRGLLGWGHFGRPQELGWMRAGATVRVAPPAGDHLPAPRGQFGPGPGGDGGL
ncbi:MAG: hypothetical protein BWY99_02604 [Synergistetes bacterium ADurb.BinA166]|nr:MAG: hypothetical protein BWY99_02604 [Synergistetes bacterium ADurb.BinA166]